MTHPLSTYAFINAKLRGRISKLLDEDFFVRMARSRSFPEAIGLLVDTPYSGAVDVYNRTGDVKLCELELLRTEWAALGSLERFVDPRIRPFTDALLRRFEVVALKHALRLWFEHAVRGRSIDEKVPYLLREDRIHDLPLDECINATGPEAVIRAISDRPYAEAVAEALRGVEASGSLFAVEVALDRWYYSYLLTAARELGDRDATVAVRLIGLQIDILNVNWIVRMRRSYGQGHDELLDSVVPGGTLIRMDDAVAAYRSEHPVEHLLGALGRRNAIPVGRSTSGAAVGEVRGAERLALLEELLRSVLFGEVRRTLGGYPFTIGILLAYILLAQNEVRLLVTVLNAKYYDLPAARIEGLL